MQAAWFRGVKDKSAVMRDLDAATRAFMHLEGVLRHKLKKSQPSDYDCPSWAYKRADSDGYNRALTEVLNLIKKDD